MSALRRRDNAPEMAVRRLLHARGARYLVCFRIPEEPALVVSTILEQLAKRRPGRTPL